MVEEAIADAYSKYKMRTPIHLSIGQEAVAAACGSILTKEDYAVSTHRAHAHYLAKGGSLNSMIAEIHGKVTGCCRGRGGSMHLIDKSAGFWGSTAIVGNTIPIGVGLGLAIKLEKSSRISCIFVGDGAIEEGVFYESLNFAVLRRLPVLFVCENNDFSVYTPFYKRQPKDRRIYKLAEAIGCKSCLADGNDVLEARLAIQKGVNYIRNEQAPFFIELNTYRWREHCGPNYDNDLNYRSHAEFEKNLINDPINKFGKYLLETKNTTNDILIDMEFKIKQEIEMAFYLADQAPFPDDIEAFTGEYQDAITQDKILCEI